MEIAELDKDILREILNISLAKAADSLAMISGEKVLITVPDVSLVYGQNTASIIARYSDIYTLIKSEIQGELKGQTLMLFKAAHIARLSEVCLDHNYMKALNREKMQLSMLLEISNILTGAIVTQIANILELKLFGSPPEAITESVPLNLQNILGLNEHESFVFVILTQFVNSGKTVDLPMILVFKPDMILKLLGLIRKRATHSEAKV